MNNSYIGLDTVSGEALTRYKDKLEVVELSNSIARVEANIIIE